MIPLIVAVLCINDAYWPKITVGLPVLGVFSDEDAARDALATLWQVQATVLALTAAGLIFAFEGLSRSRSSVELWDFAVASGLATYLLFGAAALLSVPIALYWHVGRPPQTGAHVAAFVAFGSLAMLPLFLYRSARAINPRWLLLRRNANIRMAVNKLVQEEALERAAIVVLSEWAASRGIEVFPGIFRLRGESYEVAGHNGRVFDIDLNRLANAVDAGGRLIVNSRLGDEVFPGKVLVTVTSARSRSGTSAFILTADLAKHRMEDLLTQLRDEGLEAIRSESLSAIEAICATYVELWLAWPRGWAQYGERISHGFLETIDPLRLVPVHDVSRDIWLIAEAATSHRLREHLMKITGIVYKVGSGAAALGAADIMRPIGSLANGLLRRPAGDSAGLDRFVNLRACDSIIDLMAFPVRSRLNGKHQSEIAETVGMYEALFRAHTCQLKLLLDFEEIDALLETDRRAEFLTRDLWRPTGEAPNHFRQIVVHVQSCRVALLAWLLYRASQGGLSDSSLRAVGTLARPVHGVQDVVNALGLLLNEDHGLVDEWVSESSRSIGSNFTDEEGSILNAFAHIIVASRAQALAGMSWLTEDRARRLTEFADSMVDTAVISAGLGLQVDEARARALRFKSLIQRTLDQNQRAEQDAVLGSRVDRQRVEDFRRSVVASWLNSRVLLDLKELAGLEVVSAPEDSFVRGESLHVKTARIPRAAFTPDSDWYIDSLAEGIGAALALGELEGLVERAAVDLPRYGPFRNARAVVASSISDLRDLGYARLVVLVPSGYEVLEQLELLDNAFLGPLQFGLHRVGTIDEVPVVAVSDLQNTVIVFDPGQFCIVSLECDRDGSLVSPKVGVVEFGRDDAIRALKLDANDVFEPAEAKIRDFMATVRIDVQMRCRFTIRDSYAGIRLDIVPAR